MAYLRDLSKVCKVCGRRARTTLVDRFDFERGHFCGVHERGALEFQDSREQMRRMHTPKTQATAASSDANAISFQCTAATVASYSPAMHLHGRTRPRIPRWQMNSTRRNSEVNIPPTARRRAMLGPTLPSRRHAWRAPQSSAVAGRCHQRQRSPRALGRIRVALRFAALASSGREAPPTPGDESGVM